MARVCILGVGSAQGDDRLGWEVVKQIQQQQWPGVVARAVTAPSQLLDYLDGCQTLMVVDGCRSGAAPGTLFCFPWPTTQLLPGGWSSSHGLAVVEVLRLAEGLGQLPPQVLVFGMEVANCQPGLEMSPQARQALPQLLSLMREKLPRQGPGG